ncbi:MAG TPA: flagellar basal body-associated FliL family protein [Pirellulales bacterium]|nr:flagellar basal body-associated FliL family protein [Pirellulales bacterium]
MAHKPNPGNTDASQSTASSGRVLGPKLKIAAFILGVAAIEWVVAYFYLPAAAPATTAQAEKPAAEAAHEAEAPAEHEAEHHAGAENLASHAGTTKPHGSMHEVDLGEFTVTAYQPVSSSTLFISFHLYGSVTERQSEEFNKRMDDNKHRIRDNIIVIVRSAEITDLTDAGLGLIKRRILETTNKALGKPLLQGVMFSEFSFVEQ